jgi:hypothetical protein
MIAGSVCALESASLVASLCQPMKSPNGYHLHKVFRASGPDLAARERGSRLASMDRFVLAARLKPDGYQRAQALLAEHSALSSEDLEQAFDRHVIFLSETEVIFLFEGEGAHESVRALFNDPVRSALISRWLPLFDGPLHRAEEAYLWERQGAA